MPVMGLLETGPEPGLAKGKARKHGPGPGLPFRQARKHGPGRAGQNFGPALSVALLAAGMLHIPFTNPKEARAGPRHTRVLPYCDTCPPKPIYQSSLIPPHTELLI